MQIEIYFFARENKTLPVARKYSKKLVWKNPASHYDLTQTCGHKKGFSPTELTWCNDKLGVRDDKLGIR